MGNANQLGLLLWKNFLIQRRKVVVTVLEIVIPAFFALVLLFIRRQINTSVYAEPTTWPSFPVTSLNSNLTICAQTCKIYYAPNTNVIAANIMTETQKLLVNISGKVSYESLHCYPCFL